MLRHSLSAEIRSVERELDTARALATTQRQRAESLEGRAAHAEDVASRQAEQMGRELLGARAETEAVQAALSSALASVEANAHRAAAESDARLLAAQQASAALVASERQRADAVEADNRLLREAAAVHASELAAANGALRDAQRAALAAAMTAKRVAQAAARDSELRQLRDVESEQQLVKASGLECELRQSHSEAVAMAWRAL